MVYTWSLNLLELASWHSHTTANKWDVIYTQRFHLIWEDKWRHGITFNNWGFVSVRCFGAPTGLPPQPKSAACHGGWRRTWESSGIWPSVCSHVNDTYNYLKHTFVPREKTLDTKHVQNVANKQKVRCRVCWHEQSLWKEVYILPPHRKRHVSHQALK